MVTISGVLPDGSDALSVDYVLPAGGSVAVGAAELVEAATSFAVEVTSDSPVVVERLQVWTSPADISLQAAIPVVETIDDLTDLAG